MKKTTLSLALLTLVIVASWQLRGIHAEPAPTPAAPELKVAVVNVSKALTDCMEKKDIDKMFDEKAEKIKAEMKEIDDKRRDLEKELTEALIPGTKEYNEKMKEYFDTKARYESMKEYQTQTISVETQTRTEGMYNKLLEVVKTYAISKQITLVLNKTETPVNTTRNLNELVALIRTRQILYSQNSLDITAEIIEAMDTAYIKEKAAK